MEEAIKVSVLIPAYNVEQYIDQCLESVMGQTLREIEIIVTDDASTDGTLALIEAAAEKDARIRVIRHETNRGTHMARKDAVLASSGEYIMFADSDDWLELNACELAYAKARETGADIVHFGAVVENCGNLPQSSINSIVKVIAPYMGPPLTGPLITASFVNKLFSQTLWNKMYRGDLARRIYTQMQDFEICYAEDVYQNYFLLLGCKNYQGMEDKLYHYCYGRGITGKTSISLEAFRQYCAGVEVNRFVGYTLTAWESRATGDETEARQLDVARQAAKSLKLMIARRLFNCWLNLVRHENQAAAFLIMKSAWQMDGPAFVGLLAQIGAKKRMQVAEALSGADFLQFGNRQIKTIVLYYKKIRNGGTERVTALLCNLFVQQKNANNTPRFRIVLVTEEAPQEDDYPLLPQIIREQIPKIRESIGENYFSRAEAWSRIVNKYEADAIIYPHWGGACQLWDLLAIKQTERNPALLIHMHTWCASLFQHGSDYYAERACIFRLADGMVTLSETDRLFWSRINHNVRFIPNPCFIRAGETRRVSFGKHILWLGRISTEKQPTEIVRIMREVVQQDPEIICHIVGDSDAELRADIEEQIRTESLSDHIILEGFHMDVTSYYESCSLFLATSKYEGWMQTIYEAAAFGMPTVIYEMPWLPYFSTMEGWISVPQLNAVAAAEAIVRIVNDPAEWQMRSDALYQSALEYEKIDVIGQWVSLLEDLEQGRKPEIPTPGKETQILLDQISYFHGVAVHGLLSSQKKAKASIEELELALRTAQKHEEQAEQENEALKKKLRSSRKKLKLAQENAQAVEARAAQAEQAGEELKAGLLAAQEQSRRVKEKNAALEAELQTAYEQARVRAEKIEALEQELQMTRESEKRANCSRKKAQKRVRDIESSRAYRLARMISAPFQRLKKLLKRLGVSEAKN